jgi:NitT/TauT family transport system substrate-binding protein
MTLATSERSIRRAATDGVSRRALLAFAGALGLTSVSGSRQSVLAADGDEQVLKVGMANSVMTVTYPYITNAQQFGFFKQEGVRADVVMGQGTPQMLSLLVAGTAELVFCNPEPAVVLNAERNLNVRSVFVAMEGQYILAVPEDSAIQTVQDLKGKRLGMFSPQSGIDYLKARLLDAGMTTADLEIVPTAFGAQTMAAIRQKQVDAILYWSDAMLMMRYAGLKLRDLPKADWENGLYQYVGVTTQDVIDKRPEALIRALRAMAQGQMMSVLAPEMTVEAFWKQYPDQAPKPEARETAFKQTLARVNQQNTLIGVPPNPTKEQLMAQQWGNQTLAAWTRIEENLFRIGSITRKIDPARVFENKFVEPANKFDRAKLFEIAARK